MIIVERKSLGFQDIVLGRCGENKVLQIRINIQGLIDNFGEGNAVLVHKRSMDSVPYLVPIEREGTEIVWTVSSGDTNYPGVGECEIRWLVDDAVAKTIIYKTIVRPSLTGETTPQPPHNWYDMMIDYLNDHTVTDVAVISLPSGSEPTVEYEDGLVTFGIPAGAQGAKGEKGDKGDKGDTGATGAKGDKGDKGDQGIQGEKGDKGDQGIQGEKGDTGATGAKGDKGDKGDTGAKGDQGETGNGIASVEKTGTQGGVDTYTITMTDGTTATFTVTNSEDIGAREEIEQLKNALSDAETAINAVEIVDNALGAIASFADGSNGVPVKGLTVQMEPIQAGSGDPSPDNVRPISGRTEATVTRAGVNVWDEETERGNFDYNTRRFTPSVSGGRLYSKNFIPVISGQSYYFKNNTNHPDSDLSLTVNAYQDENANGVGIAVVNGVFTVPNNCHFIMVSWLVDVYGTTYNHDISVNYPSSDHDYHEGHVQTVEIPLGQTVYGGTLDVTQGVLTVDMAMVTLDGSDDESFSTGNYGMPFITNLPNNALRSTDITKLVGIFSNQMKEVTQSSTWGSTGTCSAITNSLSLFFKLTDDLTEVSALRTYLASNPMQLCYKLAQPVEVQLTAQQLTTLLGQNNVWSDADSVAVDYVADTKRYISKVIADALS